MQFMRLELKFSLLLFLFSYPIKFSWTFRALKLCRVVGYATLYDQPLGSGGTHAFQVINMMSLKWIYLYCRSHISLCPRESEAATKMQDFG